MDRKERTLRALQGLPVDRPPMVFWHHFVGADMEKENFVDSHVRFYRETGEDFIKMMCDGFVALPNLNVQRPCDWRHIALPSMDDPFVQDQLTHIKRLREAIQDETAVFYNVFNPVSTLRSSTSDELVYDHLERREPALFEAITRVNEFKMEFMHRLISDAGVTGMFLPMQNNDLNGFTGACYHELLRPYDLSLVQEANRLSPYNIIGWKIGRTFPVRQCIGMSIPINYPCRMDANISQRKRRSWAVSITKKAARSIWQIVRPL